MATAAVKPRTIGSARAPSTRHGEDSTLMRSSVTGPWCTLELALAGRVDVTKRNPT